MSYGKIKNLEIGDTWNEIKFESGLHKYLAGVNRISYFYDPKDPKYCYTELKNGTKME